MGDLMLQVKNISKSFDQFQLKNISFTLPKGSIMGLIGPNGAGKTTFLHILLGLYKADKGEIIVNNYSCLEEKAYKDSMGFVLNEDLFLPELSLQKNAEYFGSFYSRYSLEKFKELCETYQLPIEKKLKKLSKGEKLKFQFAFALSHKPKLLVLDEPTANFDPEFREEFIKTIIQFVNDEEHSVLLVTHLTNELDRIADYITFIYHGEIVFSKDKESMYDSYRLLMGEDYKLNLIRKEKIIYKETGEYSSKAFVYHTKRTEYDKEITVQIPSIEDIMYFILKERGERQ